MELKKDHVLLQGNRKLQCVQACSKVSCVENALSCVGLSGCSFFIKLLFHT